MNRSYEIRDPIHGFIRFHEWERDIINHSVFQRLRRIRQLGFTDMVYPGAMHTRFEHSLGVMHVATRMFDGICEKRRDFLKSELAFNDDGLGRDRVIVRLSCLLHDVGHAPFSHASEGIMPKNKDNNKSYKHEDYSAAIVTQLMHDVIESHPQNQNYKIKAIEIADFLEGNSTIGRSMIWRDILSSQLDADRADYLLRDSHHIGVAYGHYDLSRLISTLTIATDKETLSPLLAVEEGGEHVAEALIIARYMMFTQVYFQHTRRAYDYHSIEAIKHILNKQQANSILIEKDAFPPPLSETDIESYLKWDDWGILGFIHDKQAGPNGEILLTRNHYRSVFETPEIPSPEYEELATAIQQKLGSYFGFKDIASNSLYKLNSADIPILLRPGRNSEQLIHLSDRSSVVKGLKNVDIIRIYVPCENQNESLGIVNELRKERRLFQ